MPVVVPVHRPKEKGCAARSTGLVPGGTGVATDAVNRSPAPRFSSRPTEIVMLAVPSHSASVPSSSCRRVHPGRSHSRLSWSTGRAASAAVGEVRHHCHQRAGTHVAQRRPQQVDGGTGRECGPVPCQRPHDGKPHRQRCARLGGGPRAEGAGATPERVRRDVGDLDGEADRPGCVGLRPTQGERGGVVAQDHGGLRPPRLTGEELVEGPGRPGQGHHAAVGGVGSVLTAVEPVPRAEQRRQARDELDVGAERRDGRPQPLWLVVPPPARRTVGAPHDHQVAVEAEDGPGLPVGVMAFRHDPVGLVARSVALARVERRDTAVAAVGGVGHGGLQG